MVCINPDGSLAATGRAVLSSLIQPGSLEEIAYNTGLPAHRIRLCLQELLKAGLMVEEQGRYRITDIGIALLNS